MMRLREESWARWAEGQCPGHTAPIAPDRYCDGPLDRNGRCTRCGVTWKRVSLDLPDTHWDGQPALFGDGPTSRTMISMVNRP